MERAFLTRAPNINELGLLKKFLGSYRDGSGNNKEKDGSTRADSRQIERCFSELLHGTTTENKSFYDFVVESNESGGIAVRGASIKSKEIKDLVDYKNTLSRKFLRAHLELSNSSAKDWKLCAKHGLTKDDFESHKKAEEFGKVILLRQDIERETSEAKYIKKRREGNVFFVEDDSVFISLLYSPVNKGGERKWLVSSFSIKLPQPTEWGFRENGNCVVGKDSKGEVLYEWYALSGSQFKYYPRLSDRIHGTDLFELPRPAVETLRQKVSKLFGD